jgi:hypothetical protein
MRGTRGPLCVAVADQDSGGSTVRGGDDEYTGSKEGGGVPESHGGSGDNKCGKGTRWMGTLSGTTSCQGWPRAAQMALEVPPVSSPRTAHGVLPALLLGGACGGGGGGWDYQPMRNSCKSASSSWIPAMFVP